MADDSIYRNPIQSESHGKTQRARILRILIDARGEWVPLPQIMACAAQYNARLFELRHLGFQIENKTETAADGSRHSWFRLVSGPSEQPRRDALPAERRSTGDWYTDVTGKPRPTGLPDAPELPLFAGSRQ